jgi:hypothetical protein
VLVGLLALIALVAVHPGQSRADFWSWVSGMLVEPDDEPEAVSLSEMSIPPDAIVTAPGEARTIQLGRDLVELYPSTAITFEISGRKTTVHLLAGTIRAHVMKRKNGQVFQVRTPLLVGTVKGTVFEVSTRKHVSTLSVYEGRVALEAVNGNGGIDVTPGHTGTVSDHDAEARLGGTPEGGAAAAAKAAAKAAGYADNAAWNRPSGEQDGQSAAGGKPAADGKQGKHAKQTPEAQPEASDDRTPDGQDDGEKDKDSKHGKHHTHGHEHGDSDDGDDD